MKRLLNDVPPGIGLCAPPVNCVLESSKRTVRRSVVFFHIHSKDTTRWISIQTLKDPLAAVMESSMGSYSLSEWILHHEKHGKLDLTRSLSDYELTYECEIWLVETKIYTKGWRPTKPFKRRFQVEIEEGAEIKKLNPLGWKQVKDLFDEKIVSEGVLIAKTKEQIGGAILNSKSAIDQSSWCFLWAKSDHPFKLCSQISDQEVKTEAELMQSIKKALGIADDLLIKDNSPQKEDATKVCRSRIKIFLKAQAQSYRELIRQKQINIKPLYALPLWTADLFFHIVNSSLRGGKIDNDYKLYLTYLEEALKLLPSQELTVYRGYKDYKEVKRKPRDIIFWPTVNSTSDSRQIAESQFCNEAGTLFTIHAKHAKDIQKFSTYRQEKEYLLPAFTRYRVINYKAEKGKHVEVEIEQIPTPRSTNVILWIAKQVDPVLIIELEVVKKFSVMRVKNNSEAMEILENQPWLTRKEYINFQVVTDCEGLSLQVAERREYETKAETNTVVQLLDGLAEKGHSNKLLCYVSTKQGKQKLDKLTKEYAKSSNRRTTIKTEIVLGASGIMRSLIVKENTRSGSCFGKRRGSVSGKEQPCLTY